MCIVGTGKSGSALFLAAVTDPEFSWSPSGGPEVSRTPGLYLKMDDMIAPQK